MSAEETRKYATGQMASAIRTEMDKDSDFNHVDPEVCVRFAEAAMSALLGTEYLITNEKILRVIETSGNSYGDEEAEGWDVYTEAEPYEDDEDDEDDEDPNEAIAAQERQDKIDADDADLFNN